MLPLPRKGDDAMKYVCKRILMLLVTMVIVSLLAFAAFELIHGSAAEIMLGTQATPERVAELEAELGLDRPFAVRYLEWLAGFFTGDLGISYSYSQPVWELIAPKVGITLCLSLLSFALIAMVSIPLGLWASRGHSRVGDAVGTVLDQLCIFHRHPDFLAVQHHPPLVCPRPIPGSGCGPDRGVPVSVFRGCGHRHPPDRHDRADAPQHHSGGDAAGLCPHRHLPGQ